MQVVILCGGSGTRLREETEFRPKPMIHIGGKPLLWHIMKYYAHFGHTDFVLALGYKQEMVKDYFYHYQLYANDTTIKIGSWKEMHESNEHGWVVTLADTGETTLKGGRLKRVQRYINGPFAMTYGDGVCNVDINKLLEFHNSHGRIATVTGVHPQPRFGELKTVGDTVVEYLEKPESECLTNGGYFIFHPEIFGYLTEDGDLEIGPLEQLAREGQLMVYRHDGYWGCMDNPKDMGELNARWNNDNAPWKLWG